MSIYPLAVAYKQEPPKRQSRSAGMSQTRNAWDENLSTFDAYLPFQFNFDMYSLIRNSIPIVSSAIQKICFLLGDFTVDCQGNRQAQEIVDRFKGSIQVNMFDRGFMEWMRQMLDSTIELGGGIGEAVPNMALTDFSRLKIAPGKYVRFIKDDKDSETLALGMVEKGGLQVRKIMDQDFVYYLAIDKRQGHPQGYSMLHSLPFVANMIMRLWNAIKNQVMRSGDPTYCVVVEPSDNSGDQGYLQAQDAADVLGGQWTVIQEKRMMGGYGDVFGAIPPGAKIQYKVIGGDVEVMQMEVPLRNVLEELLSVWHLPPFMFGINWATTERLSTHQNDMIVNMIKRMRSFIDPMIEKIFTQLLLFHGFTKPIFTWKWDMVNLLDESEMTRAEAQKALAFKNNVEARLALIDYGFPIEESVIQWLIEIGVVDEKLVKKIGPAKAIDNVKRILNYKKVKQVWQGILGA